MRKPRLKPLGTWHHVYYHAVGSPSDRPFGPEEKAKFLQILEELSHLFLVEIATVTVMSNHVHLVLRMGPKVPSLEVVAQRYAAYYHGRRRLDPDSPQARQWQARLVDLSWFMRYVGHRFALWYNRTRREGRRGPVWAGRYQNTVLEGGEALWRCVVYGTRERTATAGLDYVETSGILSFIPGQTIQSFTVPILQDDIDDPNETIALFLTNPSRGAILGTPVDATLTIL